MSVLKNNLNISDFLIHKKTSSQTIEFCFLYLTDSSFKDKSPEKQIQLTTTLRKTLGEQLKTIVESNKTSQQKTLLTKFDKLKLHEALLDETVSLEDDFIFVIENILKSHRIITSKNKLFYLTNEFKKNDKIILIHKEKNNTFFPIYSKDDKYIFTLEDDVIKLITSFQENNSINESVYNETDKEKTSKNSIYIVNEDEIEFEDFDENLVISYNNKNFAQKFSKDEQIIYIQNLLTLMKDEKGSGLSFSELIDSKPPKDIMYDLQEIKVSDANKRFEDYDEYIDGFKSFKDDFRNKQYINSSYYETDPGLINAIKNEDVLRNSFTSVLNKLDNSEKEINYDICIENFSKASLENVLSFHKIEVKSNSKKSLCVLLTNYNFLEKLTIEKISDNYTLKELQDIVTNNNIDVNKTTFKSKDKLLQVVINHKETKHIYDHDIFTYDELAKVAQNHNLNVYEDKKQFFDSLIQYNLLNGASAVVDSQCDLDHDVNSAIMINDDAEVDTLDNSLESFRPIEEDKLSFIGFYLNGNPNSPNFQIFDVANYISILNNLESFLPLKCEIHYFDSTVLEGEILEILEEGSLLKLKTINDILYYNLQNILENKFYIYTNFNDGYKYNKHHIYENIFFKIDDYPFEDMKKFVSLTLKEYLTVFHVSLTSFDSINNTLKKFNTNILNLHNNDLQDIIPFIEVEATLPVLEEEIKNENLKKKSNLDFLQFNESNISDMHKMFLLQQQNYFRIIHDIYIEKYKKQTLDNLDTTVNVKKTDGIKKKIIQKHNFNSFEELKEYKDSIENSIEHNQEVEIESRDSHTTKYLSDLNSILESYTTFLNSFEAFMATKHEKEFILEKNYVKKQKTLEGYISDSPTFINSDPNLQHAVLVDNDVETDMDKLDYLVKIVGVKLSKTEKDYIRKNKKNILKILINLKKSKNVKTSRNDLSNYEEYSEISIYSAFITLFAQFKYDINDIFKPCKDVYSLHGFPLDDAKERTFTKYIACVVFNKFSNLNKYYQSIDFCESQIQAIIRIIFQKNPALKEIFNKLDKSIKKPKELVNNELQTIKPLFDKKELDIKMNKSITKEIIGSDYQIHSINNKDFNSLIDKNTPLQIVHKKLKLDKLKPLFEKFDSKISIIKIIEPEIVPDTEEVDDDLLSSLVQEFVEFLGIDIKAFKETFILQRDSNVLNYSHLIKTNLFLNEISKREFFEDKIDIIRKYLIKRSQNISDIVYNTFLSVQNILKEIFETENIFTYLNNEMNGEKRLHFNTFISNFQIFINKSVENFMDQNINEEVLKQKSEVLREIQKQEKMSRYDNLEDDEMYIFMELERTVGISIERNTNEETLDDVENNEMNQISADDDIEE